MSLKWYIVHTYSGYERRVKESIERRVETEGLSDKITKVLIPMETVYEVKDGRKKPSERKFFPGYILVRMVITEDDPRSLVLVKNTPNVSGFVGTKNTPTPIDEREVRKILGQMEEVKSRPKPKVEFEANDSVKVTSGPFANFTGIVEEVNYEKGKLKVMVSIFGRQTPVELEFHNVEKSD